MKTIFSKPNFTTKLRLLLAWALVPPWAARSAPLGTEFSYQGHLNSSGAPATGLYDFRFTLFDLPTGGTPVGLPSVITPNRIPVTNGLFTVRLDFGAAFSGQARWLDIEVKTNAAAGYDLLVPRHELTPAPNAIFAAIAGSVAGSAVGTAGLANGAVTSSKITDGTIVAADLSASLRGNTFWGLTGNASTTPGTHFIGTTDNQPLELKVDGQRGLRLEPTGFTVNVIGGSELNSTAPGVFGATISGGERNMIQAYSYYASIGGGENNMIKPGTGYATIGGGVQNTIQDYADYANVGGGYLNEVGAILASIGGGYRNTIHTNCHSATISGGYNNMVQTGAISASIGGGFGNTIQVNAEYARIGGGWNNTIQSNAWYACTGGGQRNTIQAGAHGASIGGGGGNTIQTNASGASIGGGAANTIQPHAACATIGGGFDNLVQIHASYASIGGGYHNVIQTNASYSILGGGYENTIQSNANFASIGGGLQNTIHADANCATIGGGGANRIQPGATFASISGGEENTIRTRADYATIAGGQQNTATNYAFAAGRRAKANHTGAFVWADSTGADFASTAPNQFRVRAGGGMEVVGGIRAGVGGSLQSRVQFGSAAVGTGIGGVNTFTIAFPAAFSIAPRVFVVARGNDNPDIFAISTRAVTASNFKVNILRVDLAGGWGQNLQVDWYAVE